MAANSKRVYLLDTSILLHLVRGKALGKHLLNTFGLLDLVYRAFLSIVSHGELQVIADRRGWGAEKRKALESALSNLITIDLDDQSIIDAYVEVSREAQQHAAGARALSDNDKWIAASAKAAKAILLTTDRDFLPLHPGCCIVQFVDPANWR